MRLLIAALVVTLALPALAYDVPGQATAPTTTATAPTAAPEPAPAPQSAPTPQPAPVPQSPPAPQSSAVSQSVGATNGFVGDVDELTISKIARPPGFIKAEAIGQGPDQAKFIAYSVDEETAS